MGLEEILAGKWLAWVGAVALIVGAAFFFYYAVDRGWIGETARVAIGLVIGMAGFAGGAWAMLRKYRILSQSIVGASLGILYLSLFASFQLYEIVPQSLAFGGMVVVTAAALVFSTYFDGLSTAVLGLLGGFLTPVMLSTGVDAQWTLFGYILILDVGVLGVATFRKWQTLQILAFVATCAIWLGWFHQHWSPAKLGPTVTLMTAFFVLFALLGVWFNVLHRQRARPADFIVILATPLAYFVGLYSVTVKEYAFLHGLLAVGLAGTYLALGLFALYRNPEGQRVVVSMGGLAAAFLTLAIPLQFTGHWIVIAWAAESLLLFELGLRFNEIKLRGAGLALLAFVQIVLLSYAVETLADPAAFDTRFTRVESAAVIAETQATFAPKDGFDQLAGPVAQTPAPPKEATWTAVFNGRMFSFLASAIVLGVVAWEYRRRFAGLLSRGETAAGTTDSPHELHPMRLLGGIALAAAGATALVLLLLETYSLGYLKGWTFSTHFGLYAIWAAIVALLFVAIGVRLRPVWIAHVGLAAMGLAALFLAINFLGTLAHASPLDTAHVTAIEGQPPPRHAVWDFVLVNPRGLSFLVAVAAALLAGWVLKAGEAKRSLPASIPLPQGVSDRRYDVTVSGLLCVFAYVTTLAMLTIEVYAQGVLRDWQRTTALAVTLTWVALAIISLLAGIFAGRWMLRILALGLFLLTTLKVFVYDIWTLPTTVRVVAFVALGVALLLVSFLYRRFRGRIRAWIGPAGAALLMLALAAVFGSTLSAQEGKQPDMATRFQMRWSLSGVPRDERSALVKITLPPEVYRAARGDLGDVRILAVEEGRESREIPFVVAAPQDVTNVRQRSLAPLNLSQRGGSTEFLLDLGATVDPVNEIEVRVSEADKNYERPASVFGADQRDAEVWNLLTDKGVVLDFTRPGHRFTRGTIAFPPSRFAFYRIVIDNQGEKPLSIEGATIFDREVVRVPRRDYPGEIISQTTDEKAKTTAILVDLAHAGLPTIGLEVAVEFDGNYHRPVTVSTAETNAKETVWRDLAVGDLYRIERPGLSTQSSAFSWPESAGRYLKLVVHNGDDPPLSVASCTAKAIDKHLVVPLKSLRSATGQPGLYAGSRASAAPQYDLARTIASYKLAELPALSLGPPDKNPLFTTPSPPPLPWSEEHKVLLWTATIGGVVVLGILTVLLLRKAAAASRSGGGGGEGEG